MVNIPGRSLWLRPQRQAVVAVLAVLALAASGSTPMTFSVKTVAAVSKTMPGTAGIDVPRAGSANPGRGIAAGKPRLRCDGRRRGNAKGPKGSARRDRNVPIHRRRPRGRWHLPGAPVDLDALN